MQINACANGAQAQRGVDMISVPGSAVTAVEASSHWCVRLLGVSERVAFRPGSWTACEGHAWRVLRMLLGDTS